MGRNCCITIERQYGSGGREVARILSERLGIPCYGRELLAVTAADNGISIEELKKLDEKRKREEFREENMGKDVISLVKKYVESHVRTASLEDAADYVNMNAQYLSRLYKKKSGQNFSDYVMEVKMKESQRLLKDSRYRIREVSEMVGYTNEKNFARAFHLFCQMSPREYRDSQTGSQANGGKNHEAEIL